MQILSWLCILGNTFCLLLSAWILYLYAVSGKNDPMSAAMGGAYISIVCCIIYISCVIVRERCKLRDIKLRLLTIACAFIVPLWIFAVAFSKQIFLFLQGF